MKHLAIKEFIEQSSFVGYLESCWNGTYYLKFPVNESNNGYDPCGINTHILFYLVYTEVQQMDCAVPGRAAKLAVWLADQIDENGLTREENGTSTDHPAANSTVADAIGIAAWYAKDIGISGKARQKVVSALLRMVELNYRIRYPEGCAGKSQQLRFELRVYYWAWLLTGSEIYKQRFFELFDNGIERYTNPAAIDGALQQPSMRPDWTWNYVCSSGDVDYATSTHTPAYYCTEANGFLFVYMHGLKNGFIKRNPRYDRFCKKYLQGLMRNLSRAGHLCSDLDGYGIHRAWFGPVLIESVPCEAAQAASILGLPELGKWLRWYIDRYIDYVMRDKDYPFSGLPGAMPYGHKIGIEAQFSKLAEARFYGTLVRGIAEFDIEKLNPVCPPAFASYAWCAKWLRISTPVYETSFSGATSLRNVPVVKNFGDPNLGTLIGGAPVTTLFAGNSLMYAASFPLASLWHIEVKDHNGRTFQSAAASFNDETSFCVRHSAGDMLAEALFEPYSEPVMLTLKNDEYIESLWTRQERKDNLAYAVKMKYSIAYIETEWLAQSHAGHYVDKISFCIPIPDMDAEWRDETVGEWCKLDAVTLDKWPVALRWSVNGKTVTITLNAPPDNRGCACRIVLLPDEDGMPGGKNAFCPYRIKQVRLELTPTTGQSVWRMKNSISF